MGRTPTIREPAVQTHWAFFNPGILEKQADLILNTKAAIYFRRPRSFTMLLTSLHFLLALLCASHAQNNDHVANGGECNVNVQFYVECNWANKGGFVNKTATSHIAFQMANFNNDDNSVASNPPTYLATVTFLWGLANVSTGSNAYPINEPISVNNTYVYSDSGYYEAGYSIVFGKGSGTYCENRTLHNSVWITYVGKSCEVVASVNARLGSPSPMTAITCNNYCRVYYVIVRDSSNPNKLRTKPNSSRKTGSDRNGILPS